MLFKKYKMEINGLRNELEELRNKTKTFHESFLEEKKKNANEICKLNRIINNYIPGKITYMNNSEYTTSVYRRYEFCYIYKDGHEYEIGNLELNNVTFEIKTDNVIVAKNWIIQDGKDKYQEYVIDLYEQSFIRVK